MPDGVPGASATAGGITDGHALIGIAVDGHVVRVRGTHEDLFADRKPELQDVKIIR